MDHYCSDDYISGMLYVWQQYYMTNTYLQFFSVPYYPNWQIHFCKCNPFIL